MHKLYVRRGISLFLCLLFIHFLNAQSLEQKLKTDQRVESYTMNPQLKTPSFIQFNHKTVMPASEASSVLQKIFGLTAENEVRLMSTTAVGKNVKVEKYKQFFRGIKVEHSSYSVISKNGILEAITAESYPLNDAFQTAPQMQPENARAKALDFVRAAKYAWDAIEEDKKLYAGNVYMQQKLEALRKEYTPKGELVIAKDVYGTKGPRLAYKFDVFAVQPLSRNIIFVDAITGKILLRDAVIKHIDKIKKDPKPDSLYFLPNYQYYGLVSEEHFRYKAPKPTASVPGTGLTRYSGVRQIYTTKITVPLTGMQDPNNPTVPLTYSGVDPRVPVLGRDVYILKDDTRGGGIETYDCNNVGGVPLSLPQIQAQATAFVDNDNNWKDEGDNGVVTREDHLRGVTRDGSNGANEALNDDIAIDAHWGAGLVYDYWKNEHNRLSYDNKNSSIKSYVHYGPAYDNAFWNGSSMTYGDGSGTAVGGGFRPLVSLDVCGHEIGHGVCTFTSDLVYESESGAMNEGLSDIWAAAIERYAKENVDASLKYEYFQIGEQIAADNEGLRRMDNPKRYSNPDTYGGQYWDNPDCVPNLANDQCGVHNNSGVLNKWFYLMVMGPNKTTGTPAYTDDGIADKPRTTPAGTDFVPNGGNNYGALAEFLGLGFHKAEQITYLMELSLTPNAKFADARAASIAAARVLYGTCSQEEMSVTDAWFGVNVGAAWAGCTAPTLSVNVLDTAITEGSGDCNSYQEVTIGVSLIAAQGTETTVNLTAGGTAEAHDYAIIPGSSVSFAAGETGNKTITLRIYNDDLVEGDETINLTATSAFGDLNFSKVITIMDDDVLPRLGNTFTLLNETFDTAPDDAFPAGWDTVNKTNPTGGLWNVRTPQPSTIQWTTKRAYIYNPNLPVLTKQSATYDITVASNVILRTPLIDGRGLDSIRLQFVWSAGGEGACSPACDYGEVVYSLDGVNFNRFDVDTSGVEAKTASEPLFLSLTDSVYNQVLPKVVSNRQFYLGFRWVNDDLATSSPAASITIDNIVVTGQGRKIETDSLAAVTTRIPMEPGAPAFLYSKNDKGLLSSIVNNSADLGCVTDTLIQTGNGVVPYQNTRRSRKVHEITPTQNNSASYKLTLYYRAEEVAGFTVPPSQLRLLKSNAATIDQSTPSNSVIVTPRFIDSSAQGFYGYEATFNGFSKFTLVEPTAIPLPVSCIDFKATKGSGSVALNWKVGSDAVGITFEVERSTDGSSFTRLGSLSSTGAGQYNFTDHSVNGLKSAYYRIREVAANGSGHYLCTVLFVSFDGRSVFNIGNIYPNPGRGEAVVDMSMSDARKLRIEYVNTVGQVVNLQNVQLPAGATRVTLNVRSLASGSYLIRFRDEDGKVVNTQQFIRQ